MKTNKKGFTLIELLAVIVILAVIALIATPLIMGVIDDAKMGAAENSAYGFVKAVENSIATTMIKDTAFVPDDAQSDVTKITGTTGGATKDVNIDFKGTGPTRMGLVIKNGVVSENSTITVDGYNYKMDSYNKWIIQPD